MTLRQIYRGVVICIRSAKPQNKYQYYRRATQRCNVSAFFYAKICSLLARRRSSQPVQRVYWPEDVIDWLGKWRPTCVMRHARGQKLQSFRRKWPFYMDLYSMAKRSGPLLIRYKKPLRYSVNTILRNVVNF